jgi:outer membrane lipoprotein SlyB
MKRNLYVWVVAIAWISIASCYTPQGRPDYTGSGALAGGATGAVIGSMAGRGPGAVVGGAVGAIVGGLIGHGLDQEQEAQLRAQAPQTMQRVEQGQPLTVPDVKALVSAGISDDLIISQIRNSRTVYRLSTSDIIDLKNSGTSERVIDFMINTPTQIPSTEVAGVAGRVPPAPQPETIVVAPGPDYVWVGGAWFWMGNGWAWHRGYWHRPLYPYGYGHRHGHRWR